MSNNKLNVNDLEIVLYKQNEQDFISLTNMARFRDPNYSDAAPILNRAADTIYLIKKIIALNTKNPRLISSLGFLALSRLYGSYFQPPPSARYSSIMDCSFCNRSVTTLSCAESKFCCAVNTFR